MTEVRLARRSSARPADDFGFGLIEVLVAMTLFAVIATGVALGLTTSLVMVRDAREREVATNLAAEELGQARSLGDVFAVVDDTHQQVVGGTTFTVTRSTNWVTSAGSEAGCGSGGGQLQYKRVNVTVSWAGMRESTAPVRADTAIAPGRKLNDPGLGTILVSVLGASGTGSSGVTVSAVPASPANGAVALTETPRATDEQGCSYLLKVQPGNYTLTVSRTNYVDTTQSATATTTVGVAAGAAASAAFQYDLAGLFTLTYAGNVATGSTIIPSNLSTTLRSTYGLFTSTASSNARTRSVSLHPFSAGYEALAGKYLPPSAGSDGCVSPDPAAWTTAATDGAVGQTLPSVAAVPGGTAGLPVPMGVFQVSGLANQFVSATSAVAAPEAQDPGCAVGMTFAFGKLPSGATAQLALPFGSWRLSSGSSSGSQTTPVPAASLSVITRGGPVAASGILTLDPRAVVTP